MQRDFVILVVKVACVHPVSYNCASHLIYASKLFKVFKLFKDDGPVQWLLGPVQSLPGVVAHALLAQKTGRLGRRCSAHKVRVRATEQGSFRSQSVYTTG